MNEHTENNEIYFDLLENKGDYINSAETITQSLENVKENSLTNIHKKIKETKIELNFDIFHNNFNNFCRFYKDNKDLLLSKDKKDNNNKIISEFKLYNSNSNNNNNNDMSFQSDSTIKSFSNNYISTLQTDISFISLNEENLINNSK
jgi:hypothetical protein